MLKRIKAIRNISELMLEFSNKDDKISHKTKKGAKTEH